MLSKNRKEEAFELLEEIAKINETEVNKRLWEQVCAEDEARKSQEPETIFTLGGHVSFIITFISTIFLWFNYHIVFKYLYFLKMTILFLYRCAINITFYGIALKTNDLGINPYTSFLLASLLDTVACLVTFFLIDRLNRRTLFITTLGLIGSCSMGIVFIGKLFFTAFKQKIFIFVYLSNRARLYKLGISTS